MITDLETMKKYLKEYRYIRGTMNKYLEYEKNIGLNKNDRSVLEKIMDDFLRMTSVVNSFIDSVDNIYIKQLICMRYLSGYSWTKIAVIMGGIATADCYRHMVNRYLTKHFNRYK